MDGYVRVLAFLDLLGFKEKVRKAFSSQKVEDVSNLVSRLKEEEEKHSFLLPAAFFETKGPFPIPPPTTIEVSAFSDSVVVSAAIDSTAVVRLVSRVGALVADLLEMGVCSRGGIAIGAGIHEGGIVLGPVMLDAYQLESEVASVPRVILSDAVVAEVNRSAGLERSVVPLLRGDDGFWYLNAAALLRERGENSLAAAKALLEPEIRSASKPAVLGKLRWLASHLNSVDGN